VALSPEPAGARRDDTVLMNTTSPVSRNRHGAAICFEFEWTGKRV